MAQSLAHVAWSCDATRRSPGSRKSSVSPSSPTNISRSRTKVGLVAPLDRPARRTARPRLDTGAGRFHQQRAGGRVFVSTNVSSVTMAMTKRHPLVREPKAAPCGQSRCSRISTAIVDLLQFQRAALAPSSRPIAPIRRRQSSPAAMKLSSATGPCSPTACGHLRQVKCNRASRRSRRASGHRRNRPMPASPP